MQQQKNDKTTCLLLALTTIFWGSLYTASKVLLDVIQPFTLLCLRYIIAAIAMTILQRLRKPDPNGKPRRIKGGDWKFVIMFGLGGYVLSMRSFSQKYDALTVTTYGIYVAAIGTLPLMLREIITHPEMDFLHAKYILVLFYVAIFCTTIPHSLWNYCLSRAEASTCSLFYPIQPLTSMVLGVLLLNEHMTVGFIAGAVLIVFGVLYSTLGKEKTR